MACSSLGSVTWHALALDGGATHLDLLLSLNDYCVASNLQRLHLGLGFRNGYMQRRKAACQGRPRASSSLKPTLHGLELVEAPFQHVLWVDVFDSEQVKHHVVRQVEGRVELICLPLHHLLRESWLQATDQHAQADGRASL